MDENKEKAELEESTPINESNAAKRLRLLGDDVEDKIHDETLAKKKGNFFVELWYQHKWGIIIGAILLFTVIYFIFTTTSEPNYDMYVSYAGPMYANTETRNAVDFAFSQIIKDYNSDGNKLVNFAGITYQNAEQQKQTAEEMKQNFGAIMTTTENVNALQAIDSQIMSGTVAIYLMDEALYKRYTGNMVNLEELLGCELDPAAKLDEGAVYFKKTEFFYHMYAQEEGRALGNIPDDTVLCMLPKLTTMKDSLYNNSVDMIKAILNFGK